MSEVYQALLGQRQVWASLSREVVESGIGHGLPPTPPQRIIFTGVGSSYFAAKLTALSCQRMIPLPGSALSSPQLKGQMISCSSVEFGVSVVPQRDDWVIAFSHRGRTPVTRRVIDIATQVGAFTVWVAARDAEVPAQTRLSLSTCELEKCEPHTVGMTSAVCAVMSLLCGPVGQKLWQKLSQKPNPDLESLKSIAQVTPTLILGEWEGEWIAREISLKLMEIACVRVPVFGSEEFFHGPHLYSKEHTGEKTWYVQAPHDSRSDEISFHHRVEIQPPTTLDTSLSWVSALCDLQWLVYALAVQLGRKVP